MKRIHIYSILLFVTHSLTAQTVFTYDAAGNRIIRNTDPCNLLSGKSSTIDTDGDGLMNNCDIDCDNDGIPDLTESISADNDLDGVPNYLDLDSDNDGIPDLYESGLTFLSVDTNKDGVLDSPNSLSTLLPKNSDQDGVPDYLDLDSDNDSVADLRESGIYNFLDADNDGVCDGPDSDVDGILNSVDINNGIFGTPGRSKPTDVDNDGIPSYNDLNSDGDSLYDIFETGNSTFDANTDGLTDGPTDSFDNDGISDLGDFKASQFGGLKAYPDLKVTFSAIPSMISGINPVSGTFNTKVIEVNNVPTNGSTITFRVKTASDWVINLSPGTIISGWNYQGISGPNHIFSSNMILANSSSAIDIPFTFSMGSGGGTGTYLITFAIASGSGGEKNNANNSDQEAILLTP
jgi:hypothetical protein